MFHPIVRPSFSRLFSRLRHCHGGLFILYRHHPSTFLRPFAPRPLHRFFTSMDALTPVRRALRTLTWGNELPTCPGQVSLVHIARPSTHSVTNHPACSNIACLLPLQRVKRPCTNYLVHRSGFTLNEEARRTTRPNRVRYPTDCMFTSGCSPPRLTATQLPSATGIGHNPGGGLSPLKSRLLPSALIPAQAGIQSGNGCIQILLILWMPPYQVRGRLIKSGMTVCRYIDLRALRACLCVTARRQALCGKMSLSLAVSCLCLLPFLVSSVYSVVRCLCF